MVKNEEDHMAVMRYDSEASVIFKFNEKPLLSQEAKNLKSHS